MTLLYINNKNCQKLDDLRYFFLSSLDIKSDVYKDILESGKSGEISDWLRDIGEEGLAETVDKIDEKLDGTDYMLQLSSALNVPFVTKKIPFSKCASIEKAECICSEKDNVIILMVKLLSEVEDSYVFSVSNTLFTVNSKIAFKDYKKNHVIKHKIIIPERPKPNGGDVKISVGNECLCIIKCSNVKCYKNGIEDSCQIVAELIKKMHKVTTSDIAKIREILLEKTTEEVIEKKEAGNKYLQDEDLIILAGRTFHEMMFLFKYLNIETKTNKKLKDDEFWYMAEWLRRNRINDISVRRRAQKTLADFLGEKVYYLATEAEYIEGLLSS